MIASSCMLCTCVRSCDAQFMHYVIQVDHVSGDNVIIMDDVSSTTMLVKYVYAPVVTMVKDVNMVSA